MPLSNEDIRNAIDDARTGSVSYSDLLELAKRAHAEMLISSRRFVQSTAGNGQSITYFRDTVEKEIERLQALVDRYERRSMASVRPPL